MLPRMGTSRPLLVLALAASCGGAPPAAAPPPAPLPVALPPPVAAVDLSPVAPPANLVAVLRVMQPAKIPGTLVAWTGLPIPVSEVLDELLGDFVSGLADTAQPIDVAVVVETHRGHPRAVVATSVGVHSIEEAKSSLATAYDFSPLPNGAFKLSAKRDKTPCHSDDCEEMDVRVSRNCILSPAFGPAPARVVCGRSSVEPLWPYMVRGATRIEAQSDVHAELRADGVRAAFGEKTPFGFLARELRDAAAAKVLDELNVFGADVDKLVLDGKLEDTGASMTGTLSMRDVRSPLSRALVAHADSVGPPPAAFLKLPADVESAFYWTGIDASNVDFAKPLVNSLLEAEADASLGAADRKALVDAVDDSMGLLTRPAVWAEGSDVAAAQAAIDAAKMAKPGAAQAAAEAAALAKIGGWSVLGIETPVVAIASVMKEWSALLARPGFLASHKKASPDRPAPALKTGAVPKGLPAGSQHWELTRSVHDWARQPPQPPSPPGKGAAPPPKTPFVVNKLHVLLVPDGARTWIVWSMDDGFALDRAKALVGTPAATLATRPGLEALKAARSNAGGFLTMRGLALDSPIVAMERAPSRYLDRPDPLFGLASSSQGQTPIPIWFAASSGRAVTGAAAVPRAAVRDAMGLARALRF